MKFLLTLVQRYKFYRAKALSTEKRKKAAEGLTSEQQQVQRAAWLKVDTEMNLLVEQYEAINGNILDADRAKDLFPEYAASLETRRIFLRAVYEPAQQVVDEVFRRKLKTIKRESYTVVFTAGGPSSGKSTLIESLKSTMLEALVIMDGTLSERDRALNNIDLALKAGCNVAVFYLHRPFIEAVNGAIDRALSRHSGRAVPMRIIALKHYGAMNTIISLAKHYQAHQRVSLHYLKFCAHNTPFRSSSLGEIINQRNRSASLDAMTQEAYHLLDERYARAKATEGGFSQEVYQALRSQAPSFRRPRR